MKWFRSNIKHGSRLALFALAIQFVLSFGHFHGLAAQAGQTVQPVPFELSHANGLTAPGGVSESAQQPSPSTPDSDQQQSDPCAICAVMALANAVLFATPPILLLPQAIEFLYLTTDAEFVHLNSARVAFQPRAPPRLLTSIA
jgi:hypothetical protein